MKRTGRPLTAAKSRSKATAAIVRRFHIKKAARSTAYAPNIHRSDGDTVRILPKRKALSSGTYPGVMNTKSTPKAMPSAHITAIAESWRR